MFRKTPLMRLAGLLEGRSASGSLCSLAGRSHHVSRWAWSFSSVQGQCPRQEACMEGPKHSHSGRSERIQPEVSAVPITAAQAQGTRRALFHWPGFPLPRKGSGGPAVLRGRALPSTLPSQKDLRVCVREACGPRSEQVFLSAVSSKWTWSLSDSADGLAGGMLAGLCQFPPLCTRLLFKTVPALTEE